MLRGKTTYIYGKEMYRLHDMVRVLLYSKKGYIDK